MKPLDAVFRIGMGREQTIHPPRVQRIDDEKMGRGRVSFRLHIVDTRRPLGDLFQRGGQPQSPAAEKHSESGEHGNRAGEGRRDGHDQRVAIFHMGQFMGHDTGDFLRREHAQKTGRHRHCRVFRIASGGKGVGLGIVDHIDLGRGQTGVARELVAPC